MLDDVVAELTSFAERVRPMVIDTVLEVNNALDAGKTVVVVLHDINFAASYADHIIAMKDGRVYCEGAPEAVVQDAVLSDLYEIAVRVHVLAGRRFCDYF